MPKRQEIIDTYERIEKENGGLANILPSQAIDKTANELKISRTYVRDVLVSHWTMWGSG